jgi:hypothetical protein
MAEERCTSTIPKQPKPMIEERRCFPNSVGIDAASREFNSKRYSVEPSANFADKCGVGIIQFKATTACGDPFDEKLSRRKAEDLLGC